MTKLFSEIKNSLFETNKILSLEIVIKSNELELKGIILKKKNNKIEVVQTLTDLNFEEWKHLPVILTLSGKGVLLKRAENSVEKVKIRNVFPAIKEDEFYSVFSPLNSGCFVSIIRHEVIAQIIETLKIKKDSIIDISLEAFVVSGFSGMQMNLPKFLGEWAVNYEEDSVADIKKSDTYKLNRILGEDIESRFHLAYLAGIAFFLNLRISGNTKWDLRKQEWKSKKIFQTALIGSLSFLLIFFLGNLIINNFLKNTNNTISKKAYSVSALVEAKENIQKEINRKNDFINQLQLTKNAQFANLAEEIGVTVPSNIQLTALNFNPLKKAVRKKKEIAFDGGVLIIEGVSMKSIYYHKWARELKKINWVKKIELVAYEVNREKVGEFIIEIEY